MDKNPKDKSLLTRGRLHFVGIGGVGMGTLAAALAENGFEVSGSDGALYDPMRSVLAKANVRLIDGFSPSILTAVHPDTVIIGNVVTKENSEARAWIQSGTRFCSLPEAVRRFVIEDRYNVVVAGTHGKTTTSTWIAFLLKELGLTPSYLIGGVPNDLPSGCAIGSGIHCVCEGDEYDSAFFDKGPKFLHYNPHFAVLTNIEFDHADIYRDLAHVKSSFEKLAALLPGDGLCVASADDPVVMEVASDCLCPVQSFGHSASAMWRLSRVEESPSGYLFEIEYKKRAIGRFKTSLYGEHNLMNLLSGIICAVNLGMPVAKIAPIVEAFTGVRRRQQVLRREPTVVIDDFAHHPTEVLATLTAVRRRHPGGRLFALFEARSATARRNVHQEVYSKAFLPADTIAVTASSRSHELEEKHRFSAEKLVSDLQALGKTARSFQDASQLANFVRDSAQPGDIIVVMSNGDFGGIQKLLVA